MITFTLRRWRHASGAARLRALGLTEDLMKKAIASVAFASIFALSAGAIAGSEAERAAKKLDRFERTGETTDCLMGSTIDSIDPITDELFLVRVGVNTYYLNEVNGSCDGASSGFSRLQYTRSTPGLCRLQIVSVYDNGSNFFRGSCSLGSFEKLRPKPETAPAPAPAN